MKRVYLNILKEDASIEDEIQKQKNKMSKLIVAGDSIAVGMSIYGLKQKGARCCGVTGFDNIVPVFPAVRGGMNTKWIKNSLKRQLNSGSGFVGYKLIIIAGTNDSLNYALSPSPSVLTNAIANVKDMISAAIKSGIKQEDIAIMKLAKYEPTTKKLNSMITNRKNRGWYPKDKTGEQFKEAQHYFVKQFNSSLPVNFEMAPVGSDGVHTGASGSRTLAKRALESLGAGSIKAIEIPISNSPGASHITPDNKKSSNDCHVNQNCSCIDRSVKNEIHLLSLQRALNVFGIKTKETSACDQQTRDSIQIFQKQQQDKGFKPPDGRDFLRCDACVGPNTLAAINKELLSRKKNLEGLLTADELRSAKRRIKIKMSYTKGKIEDLQNLEKIPLKGEVQEVTYSHNFPDGKKEFTISFVMNTIKKRKRVKLMLDSLVNLGITNPFVLMGILGCTGKESGFRIIFEGAGYRFKRIKEKRGAVARRVWKRFEEQGFGAPKDKHLRAITGGGRNGIALFNIAYGYSPNQKDEIITDKVLKDDEINPSLYDENKAGWKYRGTGPIQVTFKAGHVESANLLKIPHKEVVKKLKDPQEREQMAMLLSCAYMKKTYPWALKKYGKEPESIQEGLEWAQNCVGGIGFDSPATPGNVLHAGFLKAIPWIKNNFRLEIKDATETPFV